MGPSTEVNLKYGNLVIRLSVCHPYLSHNQEYVVWMSYFITHAKINNRIQTHKNQWCENLHHQ